MDVEGLKIKPAEGKLVVSFLDDEDDEKKPAAPSAYPSTAPAEGYRETCLATIRAVGPKSAYKQGQIAVLRCSVKEYALEIDDNLILIDAWDVQAVLTVPKD